MNLFVLLNENNAISTHDLRGGTRGTRERFRKFLQNCGAGDPTKYRRRFGLSRAGRPADREQLDTIGIPLAKTHFAESDRVVLASAAASRLRRNYEGFLPRPIASQFFRASVPSPQECNFYQDRKRRVRKLIFGNFMPQFAARPSIAQADDSDDHRSRRRRRRSSGTCCNFGLLRTRGIVPGTGCATRDQDPEKYNDTAAPRATLALTTITDIRNNRIVRSGAGLAGNPVLYHHPA